MDTSSEPVAVRRRRRKHSDEFKAQVVAACSQAGVSIAAVSMAHGVNANLARRWMIDAGGRDGGEVVRQERPAGDAVTPKLVMPPSFVAVPLPLGPAPASAEIRIELRRGATAVNVSWPTAAAAECATWMRELLR